VDSLDVATLVQLMNFEKTEGVQDMTGDMGVAVTHCVEVFVGPAMAQGTDIGLQHGCSSNCSSGISGRSEVEK
jgi:hypothetical protein